MRKQELAVHIWFLISAACVPVLSGCAPQGQPAASNYARISASYYRKAVDAYQKLIASNPQKAPLYEALGRLYFSHGEYEQAAQVLRQSPAPQSRKYLAISLYRLGDFTGALEVFNRNAPDDDEFRYYHALTAERLNLYDQALALYQEIRERDFAVLALRRSEDIEKGGPARAMIEDVDPAVAALIRQSPDERAYPQAGALILSCEERIEITPDNRQISTLHYIVKILNDRGKEKFSETGISYDSTYEKVELRFARTVKPDGTVADVGSRHIRDVSRYMNFPLYSNARVYIISFPEVAAGAVIEYSLKIYNNEMINKKDTVISYSLKDHEPILKADFSVVVPQEKRLHLKTINEEYNTSGIRLSPDIAQETGCRVYSWHFKDIPQIVPEPHMPPDADINPAFLISTFESWREIYTWWWGLAAPKIKADRAISDKVQELIKDASGDEEKARAVYDFCAQKIRYVAVEYGQAGYEPHKASDIFSNKYGDCKDQAILLVTMLREAGIPAWPALIPTNDSYRMHEDFPAMFFNHCIAATSLKGGIVFMDPTAETCSFGDLPPADQERNVLVCKDEGFEILATPLYGASRNMIKQSSRIKLSNDESIAAEKTTQAYGFYGQGQRYWLLYTQPELIAVALKERIQSFSIGAALENYTMENVNRLTDPVVLKYAFRGPEYGSIAGKLRILPHLASLDASLVAQDTRTYPIDFTVPSVQEYDFEIELPDRFRIKYMPSSIRQESPWMDYAVTYRRDKGRVYVTQRTLLKTKRVSRDEYDKFKRFVGNVAKQIKESIVLERVR